MEVLPRATTATVYYGKHPNNPLFGLPEASCVGIFGVREVDWGTMGLCGFQTHTLQVERQATGTIVGQRRKWIGSIQCLYDAGKVQGRDKN